VQKAVARGVPTQTLDMLRRSGIDLETWLTGFKSPQDGVLQSVALIRNHPLLPPGVPVHGLIISPETGQLDVLTDGYASDA
jgi:carbonic anhydrase